jgi:hypothetical protein
VKAAVKKRWRRQAQRTQRAGVSVRSRERRE